MSKYFGLATLVLTMFIVPLYLGYNQDLRGRAAGVSVDSTKNISISPGITNGSLEITVYEENTPVSPYVPNIYNCVNTDKFCYWMGLVKVVNKGSVPVSNVKITTNDWYTYPGVGEVPANLAWNWTVDTNPYGKPVGLKKSSHVVAGPIAPNSEVWLGHVVFDYDGNTADFNGQRQFLFKVETENATPSTLLIKLGRQPGDTSVGRFPPFGTTSALGIQNRGDFLVTQLTGDNQIDDYNYNGDKDLGRFLKECPIKYQSNYCYYNKYGVSLVNTSGQRMDSVKMSTGNGITITRASLPVGSRNNNGDYIINGPFENGAVIGKFLFNLSTISTVDTWLPIYFWGQVNGNPFGLPKFSTLTVFHRYSTIPLPSPTLIPTVNPTPTSVAPSRSPLPPVLVTPTPKLIKYVTPIKKNSKLFLEPSPMLFRNTK